MRQSTERILTTHVGSLPRPQAVVDLLWAQDRGESFDAAQFDATIRGAVADAVSHQLESGLDVVGDGEMGRIGYASSILHRLTGFEPGHVPQATPQDLDDFPQYRDRLAAASPAPHHARAVCKGPIKVRNPKLIQSDVDRLKSAVMRSKATEAFLTAPSPGAIAIFQPNEYYPTQEAYLEALAEAMRSEYEGIVTSGMLVSIDCPDLAMGRHVHFRDGSDDDFLRNAALQVEALNHALVGIPPNRVRIHVCWGNYQGPHTRDIALSKLLPVLFKAKPVGLMIAGANPRHAHEWELWKTNKLPDEKVLIPGVIDSTCNYVEHPELVAQRIVRYAEVVGRDKVIAGTDCGFGTFGGYGAVDPAICWAKMKSLSEGAAIATKKLWGASGKN